MHLTHAPAFSLRVVRIQNKIKRIYYDAANAAANHDAELALQLGEKRVAQLAQKEAKRGNQEEIYNRRVDNEADEFDSGVEFCLFVGAGCDEDDDGEADD